jgi:hypothetical protein
MIMEHFKHTHKKEDTVASHQWLMPVILATQKTEIRRIVVQSQPGQIDGETLSQKKKKKASQKWVGGDSEFKSQYRKRRKGRKRRKVKWDWVW